MVNEQDFIKRIEDIEKQLKDLKLELEETKKAKEINKENKTGPIKKGDRVRILNPSRGQGKIGIVQKINWETERVCGIRKRKKGIVCAAR